MKILKQNQLLLIGLLLITITSCRKTEMATSAGPVLTANAAAASINSAYTFNSQSIVNMTGDPNTQYSYFNTCTGEDLKFTNGLMHVVIRGTSNNNVFTFTYHENDHNLKLVGTVSGLEYTGTIDYTFSRNVLNPVFTDITTVSVVFTTPGGTNNFILKVDQHITIDANGNVTSSFDNFRGGCQ